MGKRRKTSGVFQIGDVVLVRSRVPDKPEQIGVIKYFSKAGLSAYVKKEGQLTVTNVWLEQLELMTDEDILQWRRKQIQSGDSAQEQIQYNADIQRHASQENGQVQAGAKAAEGTKERSVQHIVEYDQDHEDYGREP